MMTEGFTVTCNRVVRGYRFTFPTHYVKISSTSKMALAYGKQLKRIFQYSNWMMLPMLYSLWVRDITVSDYCLHSLLASVLASCYSCLLFCYYSICYWNEVRNLPRLKLHFTSVFKLKMFDLPHLGHEHRYFRWF